MKKLLSVVLVLAMILGSFSMVFASDFSDVKDTDTNSEAINVLSGLDVIGGYPDGTFRPEGTVTRAEMAVMIVNALGIPVKGGAVTQFTEDVPASHWASGYINYAASVGFIAGRTATCFDPSAPVSYNEAITMIVAALGYKASALPGTYPGSFINKATSLGILDVCKTTGTIGASRADIAQMLYDAADCAIGYIDNDGAFHANNGKTAGSYDTMFARLNCTDYNGGEAFVVTGDEDSDINLKKYIGAYVTATQNKDEEIIAIAEVKAALLTADADVDGGDKLIGDYKIKASAYDDVNIAIGTNAAVQAYKFENSSYTAITKAQLQTAVEAACASESSITVAAKISGNYITKIYSIATWEVSEAMVIDADDLETLADDNKLGTYEFVTTDADEIDTDEFAIFGAASLADIKEDDVVYTYKNGANKIVRVEVGTETVTGVVSKINKAETEYTIGGKVYKFSAEAANGRPDTGDEIEAKLDYNGKIYEFDTVNGEKNYAIVLDKGEDTGRYASSTKPYVKLFLADGTVKEYELDSAVSTSTALTSGALVEYTVSSKGKLDTVSAATTTGATEINAKGIMLGKEIVKSAAIFAFDGGDKTDEDNYSVITLASILDSNPTAVSYITDDADIVAIVVEGVTSEDSIPAIFTGWAKIKDDDYNYMVTAMYDGKAGVEFKSDINKTQFEAMTTVSGTAVMYKLTMDANGGVTSAAAFNLTGCAISSDITTKTSVSGNVLTIDSSKKIALAEDIVVYVYDASEDEWTVGTAKSLAVKKVDIDEVWLLEENDADADEIYEYAIVFKK